MAASLSHHGQPAPFAPGPTTTAAAAAEETSGPPSPSSVASGVPSGGRTRPMGAGNLLGGGGRSTVPSKYQPYDLDLQVSGIARSEISEDEGHQNGGGGGGESMTAGAEDDESSEDDEMVDDAPKGKHMTPLEAALAAFRLQRKMISKARRGGAEGMRIEEASKDTP